MRHPAETALALYAGGDLGWWKRIGIARHVGQCESCAAQVDEFRAASELLLAEREELPEDFDWAEAAAAMKANIRVGLAAGQCVAEEPQRVRSFWRTPALALPVLLVIIAGWILQSLPPLHRGAAPATASGAIVLDASPTGIGVERDGRGFQLLRPVTAGNVEISVRGDSVRSRYVDSETGQVTISHVYAE